MAEYGDLSFSTSEIDGKLKEIGNKQDKLVSGTNIKTVDGKTLLGSGNIATLQIGTDSGTAFAGDKGQSLENWRTTIQGGTVMNAPVVSTSSTSVTLNYSIVSLTDGGSSSGSLTLPAATTSKAGVMSAADKLKLDGLNNVNTSEFATDVHLFGGNTDATKSSLYNCFTGVPSLKVIREGLVSETIVCTFKTDGMISIGACSEGPGGAYLNFGVNTSALRESLDLVGEKTSGGGEVFNDSSNTASGASSHAEGSGTKATASAAHAEGLNTTASGIYSHSEGQETVASGQQSHAEGRYSAAKGNISHAEGQSRTGTSASFAHAEGFENDANGFASHSGGEYSVASGRGAFAHGNRTNATRDYQAVFGKYNANPTTAIFIVGGGTSSARSNLFEIHDDGTIKVKKSPVTGLSLMSADVDDGMIDLQEALIAGISSKAYNVPSAVSARAMMAAVSAEVVLNGRVANHYVDLSEDWELAFGEEMREGMRYAIILHNSGEAEIAVTIPEDFVIFGGGGHVIGLYPDMHVMMKCCRINGRDFAEYVLQ